ncbi:LCP family protein [Peribacillus sp. NPDC097675]|uniref:LCP family protein n=1 Tax=Peribacillus sp. NPDC097675 TaxID=3390618 RepID=UPI003D0357F9
MAGRLKKTKKLKLRRRLLSLCFTLLIMLMIVIGIETYSYQKAKQTAAKDNHIKQEEIDFNGHESKTGKTNVLLLGVDARGNIKDSNSDTMIVAQYDSSNNNIKIVSFMRDMYVNIPGYSGKKKMNSSFLLGGPELVRQTIKQDFGIDVEYYVMIDFKGFEKVIDALAPKGIEVNVEKSMSQNIGVSLQPGVQKLNGKELLGYSRFRHDSESDFGRVKRQQKVIEIVADEVLSANGILKAPKLLGTIQPYVTTNLSETDALGYIKDIILNRPKINQTLSLPIKGSYTNARVPVFKDVLEIDEEANRKALNEFFK